MNYIFSSIIRFEVNFKSFFSSQTSEWVGWLGVFMTHTHTHTYIYIYCGSACCIMVIVLGNGHGNMANPWCGWLHLT